MNLLSVLLALLPVVVILVLLLWRRSPADIAGVIGWLCAVLVAWLYFQTPLLNTLQISLGGIVASFPITLMVATSLLQITIMKETGAIDRVVALIKTIAPGNQVAQILILNIGVGTLLAAIGRHPGLDPAADHDRPGLFLLCRHRPALPRLRCPVHLCPAGDPGGGLLQFRRAAGQRGRRLFCAFHAGDQHLHRPGNAVAGRRLEAALAWDHSHDPFGLNRRVDRRGDERAGDGDPHRDRCRPGRGDRDAALSQAHRAQALRPQPLDRSRPHCRAENVAWRGALPVDPADHFRPAGQCPLPALI